MNSAEDREMIWVLLLWRMYKLGIITDDEVDEIDRSCYGLG